MKTNIFASILLLFIFSSQIFSQSEYVVEIDKNNGSFQKITAPIAGIQWIYPYYRAYDEINSEYIFQSFQTEQRLYSINTNTGATINNPLTNRIVAYQFDNSTGTLYGLDITSNTAQKQLVSIDRTTGALTNVGNPIPSSGFNVSSNSSFNETNHTYYFIDPTNKLYSLNATNGNIIASPSLSLNQGEFLLHIAYDHSKNILFGMLRDNNLQMYYLVQVNPSSGAITKIGNGFAGTVYNGSATLDESNEEYIFMYYNFLTYNFEIGTIDLTTGQEISNNTLLANSFGNLYSLKYDRVKQKLYSIHWEKITCQTTSSITSIPSNNVYTGGDPLKLYLGYGPQSTTLNCVATGNGPFTYSWTGQDLNNYNSPSPIFTPSSAGTFDFTVDITDSLGCTITDRISICVQDVRVYRRGKLKKRKVYICHVPCGNPSNPRTLRINRNAVSAHLNYHSGDALGKCGGQCNTSSLRMRSSQSIEEEKVELDISLYPNPSKLGFNIEIANLEQEEVMINVFSLSGQLVYQLEKRIESDLEVIDLGDDWNAGIYFIQIQQGKEVKMMKAIKME